MVERALFFRGDHGGDHPRGRGAEATASTRAVEVAGGGGGRVERIHVIHPGHVETALHLGRAQQQRGLHVLEVLHDAHRLFAVGEEHGECVLVPEGLAERAGGGSRRLGARHEDDGARRGRVLAGEAEIRADLSRECDELTLARDHEAAVRDARGHATWVPHRNLQRRAEMSSRLAQVHEFPRHVHSAKHDLPILHHGRVRRRREEGLHRLGVLLEELVRLVRDDGGGEIHLEETRAFHSRQRVRNPDDNLRHVRESLARFVLLLENTHHFHALRTLVVEHVARIAGDADVDVAAEEPEREHHRLDDELAGGNDDHHLEHAARDEVHVVNGGHEVSEGLAAAGLGLDDDVFLLQERERRASLDGSGIAEPERLGAVAEPFGHAERAPVENLRRGIVGGTLQHLESGAELSGEGVVLDGDGAGEGGGEDVLILRGEEDDELGVAQPEADGLVRGVRGIRGIRVRVRESEGDGSAVATRPERARGTTRDDASAHHAAGRREATCRGSGSRRHRRDGDGSSADRRGRRPHSHLMHRCVVAGPMRPEDVEVRGAVCPRGGRRPR